MDPEPLNLPLAVKIPVAPGSKPVFSRGKLGEKLHQPYPYFNLDDPYIHQLSPAYNCLHDPHLRDYHNRKDILKLLKRRGFVTSDNKVICTLKEFNEYRQYLTRLKLQLEKIFGKQEEGLLPLQATLKDGPKRPGTTDTSCRRKQQPQPWKPSSLSPPKSQKSGGCRKGRVALDKGQTYSRSELGHKGATSAADSQRKPDANGLWKAVFEQLTAAEAKKLEHLVETVLLRLLDRLKISGNHVSILQRVGRGIRERLLGSCLRVELSDTVLDHHQNMEEIAKELVAAVLEILEGHLAPSTSRAAEIGVAASWEELPLAGRATQGDISKDRETATADLGALSPTSLDTLTREVVDCTLDSLLTLQFEQDTSSENREILELPGGNVSNRQLQPSQTLPRQDAAEDTLPSINP